MKNVMIKVLGAVSLNGTIGNFNEASVLAIGGDVVVADVMRSGRLRYRQVLKETKPEDIDLNAKVVFVSKEIRRKLHHIFDNEEMECGNAPHFTEWSEHKVSAPGDFKPVVRRGEILVADFAMNGTHYFRLSEEDRAWIEHQDGLKI